MHAWLPLAIGVALNVCLIFWPGWDTRQRREERRRRRR